MGSPRDAIASKKVADFPYVRGGGSTNIWKIPYMFCIFFLKVSLSCSSCQVVAHSALLVNDEDNKIS